MDGAFIEKKLAVKNLLLWDENARFPDKYFNSDEIELINYFLHRPDFKIQQLIEAIVNDFDLPQLEKLIVWENENKFIVLEGNRRLTAYKLLINPQLATDSKLEAYLTQKKNEISLSDDFLIECLITKDKEDGYRFIDRKHANANNEVNWQDAERAHYSVRRGNKRQLELIKTGVTNIVRELNLPEEIKEKVLGKKYVTNFFRIVTGGPAKREFGLDIDDKEQLVVKDQNFKDKLKVIIYDLLKGEDFNGKPVNSRELNRTPEIQNYLKSIKPKNAKKVDESIKKNTSKDIFGDEKIDFGKGNRIKVFPNSGSRTYLIPKTCKLSIPQPKINNIYFELRDSLLLDSSTKAVPNAAGVLFRVFLEISIDYFLEKEGIELGTKVVLAGKITKCAEILESKSIADPKQLKNIRKVSTDKNSLLGIQNFHDYVHSYKSQPSADDLKRKWDNLQEFFQILWHYLYNKQLKKKN